MPDRDNALIKASDIATAVALLTRLPVRASFDRGARAAWAYPVAGLAVAVLAAIPTGLSLAAGLPPMLAALIWVAVSVILTGAMHEDGLADVADGLWGGWDKARRLEIMKDSHIGSYGVIALCLSLAARWLAVGIILQSPGWIWGLIAVAMLSRATMPVLMAALPNARQSGLSQSQGRPSRQTALAGIGVAGLVTVLATGWTALPLAFAAMLATAACGAIANSKIGGQTGDILGATQQVSAISMLLVLAA